MSSYNNISLINIPDRGEQSYLNNYIITDSIDVVRKHKDTGNVIILTDHASQSKNNCVNESEYNTNIDEKSLAYLYTDLYIGDEHIAGGYGFDSPFTRNVILNLPNVIDRVEDKLDNHIKKHDFVNPTDSSQDNNKSVSVNETHNIIDVDEKRFTLSMEQNTQQLLFTVSHKPSINKAVFTYTYNGKFYEQGSELEYSAISKSKNYSYLTVDYTGSANIRSFYITYSVGGNIDYEFIGGINNQIDINDTSIVEDLHVISDPIYNSDTVNKRFRIKFNNKIKEKFIANASKEGVVKYNINLTTTSPIKISKSICTLGFTYPCFYNIGRNITDDIITSSSDSVGDFIMIPGGDSVRISFNHDESEADYETILVPQGIVKHMVNIRDIKCRLDSSNVTFDWIDGGGESIAFSKTTNKINYYKLISPQKYKGNVIWNFSID